jgi:hypothetical protein
LTPPGPFPTPAAAGPAMCAARQQLRPEIGLEAGEEEDEAAEACGTGREGGTAG